jgi:hypothetical protein
VIGDAGSASAIRPPRLCAGLDGIAHAFEDHDDLAMSRLMCCGPGARSLTDGNGLVG